MGLFDTMDPTVPAPSAATPPAGATGGYGSPISLGGGASFNSNLTGSAVPADPQSLLAYQALVNNAMAPYLTQLHDVVHAMQGQMDPKTNPLLASLPKSLLPAMQAGNQGVLDAYKGFTPQIEKAAANVGPGTLFSTLLQTLPTELTFYGQYSPNLQNALPAVRGNLPNSLLYNLITGARSTGVTPQSAVAETMKDQGTSASPPSVPSGDWVNGQWVPAGAPRVSSAGLQSPTSPLISSPLAGPSTPLQPGFGVPPGPGPHLNPGFGASPTSNPFTNLPYTPT